MRALSPFLNHELLNDIIVPADSARIGLSEGREVEERMHHLEIVETVKGAEILHGLIFLLRLLESAQKEEPQRTVSFANSLLASG